MDSPALIELAVLEGRWHMDSYKPWVDVRATAKPDTEAVWIDRFLADDAVKWGKEAPGIIWYEHSALGVEIAKRGGFEFFGAGSASSSGILTADGSRTIVASIKAHGTGKNLQAFSRNLATTTPPNGTAWEQLLGRTHRPGQTQDVEFYVYRHADVLKTCFLSALADADFQTEVTGLEQKLKTATLTFTP
jgi:hypothetical protein